MRGCKTKSKHDKDDATHRNAVLALRDQQHAAPVITYMSLSDLHVINLCTHERLVRCGVVIYTTAACSDARRKP